MDRLQSDAVREKSIRDTSHLGRGNDLLFRLAGDIQSPPTERYFRLIEEAEPEQIVIDTREYKNLVGMLLVRRGDPANHVPNVSRLQGHSARELPSLPSPRNREAQRNRQREN